MGAPTEELSVWIRRLRPDRTLADPFRPQDFFLEKERAASGSIVTSTGILLTNKECPWRCLMCDLWKHSLQHTVPPGAIPEQIDFALTALATSTTQLKLYNSGSFFDSAAIPLDDYTAIAQRARRFEHVVVESHPKLVGERTLRFRELLHDTTLEVALGLETVHPEVLPRLNKNCDLDEFARAAGLLRTAGINLRVFVLLQLPWLTEQEGIDWALKSVAFAFDCGATAVSIIPTRAGNGAMDELQRQAHFAPPTLAALERAFDLALSTPRRRVFADLWDLERFSKCPVCFEARKARLETMNLEQTPLPMVHCQVCDAL